MTPKPTDPPPKADSGTKFNDVLQVLLDARKKGDLNVMLNDQRNPAQNEEDDKSDPDDEERKRRNKHVIVKKPDRQTKGKRERKRDDGNAKARISEDTDSDMDTDNL